MSTVLRRLPQLAGRAVAVMSMPTGAAAVPPAAVWASSARGLRLLRAHPNMPAAALRSLHSWQLCWQQTSRRYSALAQPEGVGAGETTAAANSALDTASSTADGHAAADPASASGSQAGAGAGLAGGAADAAKAPIPAAAHPCRVFVINIPWSVTDEALAQHFSQAGVVRSARIVKQRRGNSYSFGFGLVEFESPDMAAAAIQQLEGSQLEGRTLHVREDQGQRSASSKPPREQRPPQQGQQQTPYQRARRPRDTTRQLEPNPRVVVHGLPFSFQWQDLKDLGGQAVETIGGSARSVLRANIKTHPDGRSRGWGVLYMATEGDAQLAIEALNGSTLDGRILSAKLDEMQARQQGQQGAAGQGPAAGGEAGAPSTAPQQGGAATE